MAQLGHRSPAISFYVNDKPWRWNLYKGASFRGDGGPVSVQALAALARWMARRRDGARHKRDRALLEGSVGGAAPAADGIDRPPGTPAAVACDADRGFQGRGGR